MKVTECECTQPGWCPRHQCEKSAYWLSMCQRVPALIAAWDRGAGPRGAAQAVGDRSRERCVHLGAEIRREQCSGCRGNVLVKVLHCDIHQECTVAREIESIATCRTCGDYRPDAG